MSLVDIHENAIEQLINLNGHSVKLIDKDGNEFPNVKCIFNGVDHGLNLDNVDGDPMGEKTNVYIQRKELESKGITITSDKWKVVGKKGKYKDEEIYLAEIPKEDSYLPGVILFLTLIDPNAVEWENVQV
ncbi:MAG: hypothetical protein ACTSRG_13100 [Candidatus Helarchaeota archaeon]